MDVDKYLDRIKYADAVILDVATLIKLHEQHVFHVPFENLDIYYKNIFDIELESIYRKVILNLRGGFCYELNSLFNQLLREIGFNSRIISSSLFDDNGNLGPEYDHMSIYIETDKRYLADVGFGDLFIRPLEIKDGIQDDGRSLFKIEKFNHDSFSLSMSSDGVNFHKKYAFSLNEVHAENFYAICLDKQINPMSYFVKNLVCTKPTNSGRLTLFNNKIVEKRGQTRTEDPVNNDDELRAALKTRFNIVI